MSETNGAGGPTVLNPEDLEERSKRNIRDIADSVSRDNTLEAFKEHVEAVFDEVLKDYKNEFNAFLVAYARRLCSRIIRFIDTIENVEGELMKKERLEDATNTELIRMLQAIQGQLSEALDLIKHLVASPTVKINIGKMTTSNTVNVASVSSQSLTLGDKKSRENLRNFFGDMFKRLPDAQFEDADED